MTSQPSAFGFDDLDLARLRARRSMKWQAYPADVLPAWVAEMDFDPAPAVAASIRDALARGGDFGYALDLRDPLLADAFSAFAARRYQWPVDPDRVLLLADVMRGVELWIEGFTSPGDAVIVPTPVYHPFLRAPVEAGRRVVEVPATRGGSAIDSPWELDLDPLDAAFAAGGRLLLLCNPHNPLGRAYTEAELRALAEVVLRHDVRVVADEIHAPLVFPPHRHIPFASLAPEVAKRTLTLHSASKAFNLAGLHAAVAVCGSAADEAWLTGQSYRHRGPAGILGSAASTAAFTDGDPWLDALLAHLRGVRDHLGTQLRTHLPDLRWQAPEATYLAWLDCGGLDLPSDPQEFFLDRGRIALSPGGPFGAGSERHVRLNFATSRAVVTEAVARMAAALA
ncbi:MAG: MalY/PatB family protein [Sporichthyaceae bacterium]